ncbi:MAG: hypothetical protein GXP55_15710 [Deltaproteobacteria bacterium]|nr:hypothetical protein [Deltaproteobacteria bacterium]
MSTMLLAQSQIQKIGNAVGASQIADAGARQRAAEEAFQAATKAVEKLAKQKRSLFNRFKWLKPLITAVAAVVAVAATVTTAGTLGPLAIAGLVLMLGADYITKGLVAAGIVPKDKAVWVTMGLKLAGAAMSLGAGLTSGASEGAEVVSSAASVSASAAAGAGGEVAAAISSEVAAAAAEAAANTLSAVQIVAEAVKDIGMIVQDVLMAIDTGVNVDGAYVQRQLEQHQATAVQERDRGDEAAEGVTDGIDIVRAAQRQHARMMQRVADTQEIRARAGEASVSALPV